MGKVREWKASYYCDLNKIWIYGRLIVYTRFLRFVDDGKDANDVDFKLCFDDFVELKKETTGIFFAAIAIRVKTVKYWFSSFVDRGYVFNTIEHFWKERLFSSGETEVPRATEFLSILYDAQDTLASTGQTVQKQGQQLNSACTNMNKLHNDLDVAETIIHSLDSWLNQWNIEVPRVQIHVPESSSKTSIIEKEEYPIVYAKSHKDKHLPGTLVISRHSLDVFSAEGNPDYSFVIADVTEISVYTPWELAISKLAIGKAGYSVHLISARLVYILQTLEALLPVGKITYDEPPEDPEHEDDDETEKFTVQGEEDGASSSENAVKGSSSTKPPVSEVEAVEMSRVLQNMKSMALGIQDEQNRQLQQMDNLSDSVDKASERLRKDTRNVNKLI